jgi:hypothetical protein
VRSFSISDIASCGEHENWGIAAASAHLPGHLEAVHFRHHYIQDQQIVDTQLCVFFSGFTIVDTLHLKPLPFQHSLDRIRQQLLVFDDQYLHSQTSTGTLCNYSTVFTLNQTEEKNIYSSFTGSDSARRHLIRRTEKSPLRQYGIHRREDHN